MSAERITRRKTKPPEVAEIDEDDFDVDDEPQAQTSARARKATTRRADPMATVTRVAVRNSPKQRGGRTQRSDYGRDSMDRGRHARTEEFTAEEIRDFMREEENQLPYVPDTRDWHYKWTRCQLGDKADGSNLVAHLNGKMGYELVRGKEMLPPNIILVSLQLKAGDYNDCYQYRDSILMRCPMRNYKLARKAAEVRTRQLNEMLDAGAQASFVPGETRTGIVVEENFERTGIREVQPEGEEEFA